MDTDPELFLHDIATVCARSKYSLSEIEQIYWNEVRPAVWLNLWSPVGEWTGFEINGLSQHILEKNRFGRRLPIKWLHRYTNEWWNKLRAEIERVNGEQAKEA